MKYDKIKLLDEEKFQRLTGVKRSTFNKMPEILREAGIITKARGGRKNKLCLEDPLLIA